TTQIGPGRRCGGHRRTAPTSTAAAAVDKAMMLRADPTAAYRPGRSRAPATAAPVVAAVGAGGAAGAGGGAAVAAGGGRGVRGGGGGHGESGVDRAAGWSAVQRRGGRLPHSNHQSGIRRSRAPAVTSGG